MRFLSVKQTPFYSKWFRFRTLYGRSQPRLRSLLKSYPKLLVLQKDILFLYLQIIHEKIFLSIKIALSEKYFFAEIFFEIKFVLFGRLKVEFDRSRARENNLSYDF